MLTTVVNKIVFAVDSYHMLGKLFMLLMLTTMVGKLSLL